MASKYKIHPYCEMFPSIVGEEREKLKADIAENGLQDPIWRWGQQVIDGKNRLEICDEIGLTPDFRDWRPSAKAVSQAQQEAEVLRFAITKNLHRRHLTESQRAMIAATLATAKHGGDRKSTDQDANLHLDRKEAAEQMNVSPRSVADATKVRENATPSVIKSVEEGVTSVSDAATIANEPAAVQNAAVKKVRKKKAKTLKAAVREPGEDPVERRHKQPSQATVVRDGKRTIAAPAYDSHAIEKAFGALARDIDAMATACSLTNSPGHRQAITHLSKALDGFKGFAKQCDAVQARKAS